ncbi:DNA polymerase/3'-5' exonuclease PolX [bacterium]|nr:DNA polymerase/3'-5' exonuclease PolX [bacterium]
MINQEIANILYEIAYFLEMEGVPFKPYAYEKAAITLENLEESVVDIYEKGGLKALEAIPGIGKSIAQKIEEYIKTGKIKYYEEFKKKIPVEMEELTAVEGIGPKMVKTLYQHLGIKNLKELEKAAKAGKIRELPGFGEKTEKNILQGIEFLKKSGGRFLLGEVLPIVREIVEVLGKLKEVEKIDVAGSLRRRKETIGDVDLLVIAKNPEIVMDVFVNLPGVIKIWGKGKTRSSIRLQQGIDVDLRVVPKICYGSALQYFTGSKEHNIATRKIAIDKGLKLNEYGLFKGKEMIAGKEEKEIYKALGMDWMPPELREDRGEIEAALAHNLPKIINYSDIKGDLHCHIRWKGRWDGGANTIEEMAEVAMAMGYGYLGIASHTKALKIEHGLDEKQLRERDREIEKLNSKFKIQNSKFTILRGCEANILKDGSIDIKDEALKKLDYAIAGIHSHFKMSKEEMTERIIRAMKNPYINIISHPTGRILKRRDEYQIDFDKILRAAKETNTILEINSFPERLDLNDINIRRAKEVGVKMIINTDAHQKDQLRYIEFGIAQARRGWAEKKDIINCWPLERVLEFFNKKSKRSHLKV